MEYKKRILENTYLVAVDIKSKKILFMNVTDEHVHDDSKVLPPRLVEDVIKSGSMTTAAAAAIDKIFADGASMI